MVCNSFISNIKSSKPLLYSKVILGDVVLIEEIHAKLIRDDEFRNLNEHINDKFNLDLGQILKDIFINNKYTDSKDFVIKNLNLIGKRAKYKLVKN